MEDEEHIKEAIGQLTVEPGSPARAGDNGVVKSEGVDSVHPSPAGRSKGSSGTRSPSMSPEDEHKPRSDSESTPDNGSGSHAPKLSRKASQKKATRPPTLFHDLADVTGEACGHFQLIPDCLYGSRSLGASEHDALDCDCNEDWRDGMNHACGDDSDCINRVTKMECADGDCNCGDGCQNQRFQQKQYANVSVIKTEKKGFGLRANADLQANDFIFEYIGEVINEPTFRRRMMQYDKEGIKHFYFMSLAKNEFVDATKKGNLGRFCNHSCRPNCYVDKWVVKDKLRMGIFAIRKIQAGEELVFNYNVDRYGADPQPCYCGEDNCIGFIGGKTQTERATKLSDATREALGIDDAESWDTAVAVVKKPRKKRAGEDDEEYVNSVPARGLDEKGVQKVMASLMQCKEKWIAIKLLERIQRCDERLIPYVVRMHGYEILKTTLNSYKEDHNVVLQVLEVLNQFPRLTRNKISDSKIEAVIQPLTESEHGDIARESKQLLDTWSKLEVGYRIPRKSRNTQGQQQPANSFEERRGGRTEDAQSKTTSAALPDNVPKGPRSSVPQRNVNLVHQQRHRRPPDPKSLPAGWFIATDNHGKWYFYTKGGDVQWHKPTAPAPDAVAQQNVPSKALQEQQSLQDIIDSLSKPENPVRRSATQTPQQSSTPAQEPKKEKWRSLPLEKQMRIYENTLYPHVKYVMDKFHHKLPREDLKKFGREINKKLVASDYKNNRVEDPNSITEKQEKKVKQYVKEFFDKALVKHRALEKQRSHDKKKTQRSAKGAAEEAGADAPVNDTDVAMSDADATPPSEERKRKRSATPVEAPLLVKRVKEEDVSVPSPPPPPPPPPPQADTPTDVSTPLEEADALRQQEAELERENELNRLYFEREQLNNQKEQAMPEDGTGSGDASAAGLKQQTVMSH
jgi:[histone H3]-lysine36 N-trimethyltransferase